ncbi:hypothetical protein Sta7437_0681 [Stanieria cyanosphaera PCC 7437]|uniref:Uncharacterized protein n=1 Tax=Stanieria cyanosphaera (strain ATCC 29371 / PCC 7437) TaxID=111780 RepID=K9XQE5_STAC7|nr:hypothetical protein Sta7437_0681 [Stanieria cyanosphaera PCC 7437]
MSNIYSGLAYYWDNQEKIDADIKAQYNRHQLN